MRSQVHSVGSSNVGARARVAVRGMGLACAMLVTAPVAWAAVGAPAHVEAGAEMLRADTVNLTPKYVKGQSVQLQQQVKRVNIMELSMGKDEQRVEQTARFELRVADVTDGKTKLELELKSVTSKAKIAKGEFTWDSTQPEDDKDQNNPLTQSYRPIIGAVTTIVLDAKGNIEQITADPRVNVGVISRSPVAAAVMGLVNPDLVRVSFAPMLWIKEGAEPAKVGQTWNDSESWASPGIGKWTMKLTNTLKKASAESADIDVTGDLTLGAPEDGKASTFKLVNPEAKGTAVWDLGAGMIKSYAWKQKFTLDGEAQGLKITRSSEVDMVTTRLAADAKGGAAKDAPKEATPDAPKGK